jgi:hypothetical protein
LKAKSSSSLIDLFLFCASASGAQLARIMALPAQCAKQMTRAHEREVQVQPVYRIHQHQIRLADRLGEVIPPSNDVEQLGLTPHAQWVATVNRLPARSNPVTNNPKNTPSAKKSPKVNAGRLLVAASDA